MTAPPLFSGHVFGAVGWALFHFLWQGALVAAAFAAVRLALSRKTPAVRYAVACGALALMLALPVATAWSLARRGIPSGLGSATESAAPLRTESVAGGSTVAWTARAALFPESLRARLEALRPWALLFWFAGVLGFSLRFLGGFRAANRMTRRGARSAPEEWQRKLSQLAARLSVTRPVRLLESALLKVPTAIGALRPAILIPASVFTGLPVRGIEALLAHELAHVRRHDYLVNLLQTFVETLLFYHPAVWWVSSRIRVEREECCDDLAIEATGDPRSYARALVRLEEMRGAAPTLAVAAAGGNLWSRVVRLLRERPVAPDRTPSWLAGALALALLGTLGAAARIGPSAPGPDRSAAADVALPAGARQVPDAVVVAHAEEADDSDDSDSNSEREDEADPDSGVGAAEEATGPEEPSDEAEAPRGRISEWVLTDDERTAFRNHGVTPEFVNAVRSLGYDRADPGTMLSLRIHGVRPGDIAEMNRLFGRRPLEEHVAFKIHGVTPESVRDMTALGLGRVTSDGALALAIHGVDSDYVERLRSAGYERLSADEVVAAKIHGVRPDDAEGWKKLGYPRPSLEELVAARIHGVDPDFAADVRSAGVTGTSLEDLVGFRIHGVSAGFLREMRGLGLELSGDDATGFRIHGVTSDFVREVQALGYADPHPEDLVSLRIHGIDAKRIQETNARAGRRLPLDEIIDYRLFGKDDDDED